MKREVLGIIPARYGSVRFPGKPLVKISGVTLLQRTYENAARSSAIDRIVVATDDLRIFEHVQSFGGEAIMTSTDCQSGTDRLAEVLRKNPEWQKSSVIVNIQGDEPCLSPTTINQVVEVLVNDPEASMATAVTRLVDEREALQPSVVKCVINRKGQAIYFSRALIPSNKSSRFDPESVYWRHLGLYAYRPDFLLTYAVLPQTPLQLAEDLEQLKALEHGYSIKVAVVDSHSIGVDHPEDVNKVELWINKQNSCS